MSQNKHIFVPDKRVILPPIKSLNFLDNTIKNRNNGSNVIPSQNIIWTPSSKDQSIKIKEELFMYEQIVRLQSRELEETKLKIKSKIEQKLQKKIIPSNRYSSCFESSNLPMTFISMNGQFLSWNL